MFYYDTLEEVLKYYEEIKVNVEISDQNILKEVSRITDIYNILKLKGQEAKLTIRPSSKYKDFKDNKVWFFSIKSNGKEVNYVLNSSFPIHMNDKSIKTRRVFEYLFVEEKPYIVLKDSIMQVDEKFLKIVNFLEKYKELTEISEEQKEKLLKIKDMKEEFPIAQFDFFEREYKLEEEVFNLLNQEQKKPSGNNVESTSFRRLK